LDNATLTSNLDSIRGHFETIERPKLNVFELISGVGKAIQIIIHQNQNGDLSNVTKVSFDI